MIYPARWLAIDPRVREKLRKILLIPKTGVVEVMNNKLVCDGCSSKDLQSVTVEKLLEVLGEGTFTMSPTLLDELFDRVVDKVTDEMFPAIPVEVEPVAGFDISTINTSSETTEPKKFCDSCDSKGVKHKKTCPKNV